MANPAYSDLSVKDPHPPVDAFERVTTGLLGACRDVFGSYGDLLGSAAAAATDAATAAAAPPNLILINV